MMNMTSIRACSSLAAVSLMAGISQAASADVMVRYDFDDTDNLSAVAEENVVGTPTLTLVEGGGDGVEEAYGIANAAPDWAAAWETTASGGSYWQIDLDTTDYEDLVVEFYNRSSGNGATSLSLAWAVDGGAFTTVETKTLNRNSSFARYEVDLSSIAEVEDATSVQIRGTWGTDGTGPNTRLDDLTLYGTVIPEPGALGLLAVGGGLMAGRRRWR